MQQGFGISKFTPLLTDLAQLLQEPLKFFGSFYAEAEGSSSTIFGNSELLEATDASLVAAKATLVVVLEIIL